MERKSYIDITKGIAMLLVVMQHAGGTLDEGMRLICRVDVPLFFLCSGFLTYKIHINTINYLKKRILRILLPFILAVIFAAVFFNEDIGNIFISIGKRGYWFLEALFIMSIIFLGLYQSSRRMIIGGILIEILLLILSKYLPDSFDNIFGLSFLSRYFPCFIAGALMNKHELNKYINRWVGLILLIVSVTCFCYRFESSNMSFIGYVIGYLTSSILIFSFICNIERNIPYLLANSLCYVGKYSLNIYIIHFFLVPYYNSVSSYFIINFTVTLLTALIVTAVSILIGKILTTMTPLNKILTP